MRGLHQSQDRRQTIQFLVCQSAGGWYLGSENYKYGSRPWLAVVLGWSVLSWSPRSPRPVKAGWARTEQPEGGGKDFNARMRDLLGSEQAWDDVKSGAMASWFRNG